MAATTTIDAVRTPEERFEGLPQFAFAPHHHTAGALRLGYLDEGDGPPLLFLHGEPTWSFLFRKMIVPLRDAGFRCIAPDYAGFGRSDKPTDIGWYSYDAHVALIRDLVEALDLRDVTVVGHDWGGPIGVRLAVEDPDRYGRFVCLNTPFFTGRQTMPPAWWDFHDHVAATPDFVASGLIAPNCAIPPGPDVLAAYDAPFPDAASKAGMRSFPLHVLPRSGDLPAAKAGWRTLKAIRRDPRPGLVLWGEEDRMFPHELAHWVATALGRGTPVFVPGAGHFLPEDRGEHVAGLIADWLAD